MNKSQSFVIKLGISTFFAYMSCYTCKNLLSAIKPEMIANGVFSKISIGNMSSAFFYAYALGQLLNGLMGDKISPKKLVSLGLLCAGSVSILFPIVAVSAVNGYILWAICGFMCSMLWGPLSKIIAENISESKARTLMLSLTAASIAGQMVAYVIAAICSAAANWKTAFYITGALLIAVSITFYAAMTVLEKKGCIKYNLSSKNDKSITENPETQSAATQKISGKYLLSQGIIPAAFCVMTNGVVRNAISDWVPTYIVEAFDISVSSANTISILLPIVNLFGAILSLKLLKYFNDNEHIFSAVLFGITVLLFAFMYFLGNINTACTIAVLFIACALANAVANLYFSVYVLRFSHTGKTSGISGSLDCTAYIASAAATSFIGFASENYGWTFTIGTWIIFAAIGAVSSLAASAVTKKSNNLND